MTTVSAKSGARGSGRSRRLGCPGSRVDWVGARSAFQSQEAFHVEEEYRELRAAVGFHLAVAVAELTVETGGAKKAYRATRNREGSESLSRRWEPTPHPPRQVAVLTLDSERQCPVLADSLRCSIFQRREHGE